MPIIVSGDITPEDIAVELGRPTPAADSTEFAQWSTWINDARYLIGKRLGDLALLDQGDVNYVVRMAVAEHARHPGNETQRTVSVDDGSTSMTYRSGVGRVVIPDELWGLLDPDMANESGVGSTQLYGEPDPPPYDPWVGA